MAVLGRGVAVVEHVNTGWIQAVVLNKCTLRITRKHISWDDQNMRWETSPHACVERNRKPLAGKKGKLALLHPRY